VRHPVIPTEAWQYCPVIRESPELTAVAQRWVNAYIDGDGTALANLVSHDPAARFLGTDPTEFWSGEDVGRALPIHISEVQELVEPKFDLDHLEAFETGTTGWAIVAGKVVFANASEFDIRMILVFVLEGGVWRVAMVQNGLAVPNPQAAGIELTRGVAALLDEVVDDGESTIRERVSEGTVTLMFTDIVDSTIWLTQLGDESWARVVGWHDGVVRDAVEGNGGVVVKTLGDGVMAAFDSTRAAARAACAIQSAVTTATDQPDIEVRIGLHVGEVMLTGEDYLGRAVNKAARIASAAAGEEIMVSSAVAALLGDDPEFEFGQSTDVVLKGLEGTHQVVPLQW
jgi:adenylate cyclase